MEKKLNFKQDINYGVVSGQIAKEPRLSYSDNKFVWKIELKVRRGDNRCDIVKVFVPRDLMKDFPVPKMGDYYKFGGKVKGVFLDINGRQTKGACLIAEMAKQEEFVEGKPDVNQVLITGQLCRGTVSKLSKSGLPLADNILASNGKYFGDSTYIPVRTMGGSAKIMKMGKQGSVACVRGCFSTRDYSIRSSGEHLQSFEVLAKEFELLDMSEYKKDIYEEGKALSDKF